MRPRAIIPVLIVTLGAHFARANELSARIDESLARAARYLVSRQSPDGAWRSSKYGSFRDGPSLTPHILTTLFFITRAEDGSRDAFARGSRYLAGIAAENDTLSYPVYTAAEASWVAILPARTADNMRIQSSWIEYLRARQLNATFDWNRDDEQFGGWGYSPALPRKPAAQANLSATIFAIGALRLAGASTDDPALRDALVFVARCQNFSQDSKTQDMRYDDGGFFFAPSDAAGNKAGAAGLDASGRTRFHSYGSMTADGVRALLQCGIARHDPRVVAAREWLERNFDAAHNPGRFERDREVLRDATYFYWCWSAAHALARLEVRQLQTPAGKIDWARKLSEELLRRQRLDGSWSNEFTDSREDDELVATPFAAAALVICRRQIAN